MRALDKETIRQLLEDTRRRTLGLCELSDVDLTEQHSPLMSPMVWDLAHVGNYEETWLVRALGGRPLKDPAFDDLYDAFKHARAERLSLPILGPDEARAYLESVRTHTLRLLDEVDLDSDGLARSGAIYSMVLQHEQQHCETLLATRQLMGDRSIPPSTSPNSVGNNPRQREGALGEGDVAEGAVVEGGGVADGAGLDGAGLDGAGLDGAGLDGAGLDHSAEVRIEGGTFEIGTGSPLAYDNERPRHAVDLAPFWMDVYPVTNARWLEFIADGGYERPELWTPEGWRWRREAGLEHPQFWVARDIEAAPNHPASGPGEPAGGRHDKWEVVRFGTRIVLDPGEPVQHVCWYEADAFARWAGKRLPTEHEWECAASDRAGHIFPWGEDPADGRANLGQSSCGPLPVGSYPGGTGSLGIHGLIGDVWEWTSSTFQPWPGFVPFAYDEYSKVFFGDEYRVLRGGSWATDPLAVRSTFRNWDYPIRRQIFAGLRLARDDR